MKLYAGLLFAVSLSAAVGDRAPSVPATYVATHRRLNAPDNTWLLALWNTNHATGAYKRYSDAADAWDSTATAGWNTIAFRRLSIAYLSSKAGGSPNAAYLAKIRAIANLGGVWGTLLYHVTDGVSNAIADCSVASSCQITSQTGGFTTGCSGGTCVGKYLGLYGRTYTIDTVTGSAPQTVTFHGTQPTPAASPLIVSVIDPNSWGGSQTSSVNEAIALDWIYGDLDAATRTQFEKDIDSYLLKFEVSYGQPSPYNDQFFTRAGMYPVPAMLAIFDGSATYIGHWRFVSDMWLNTLIPAWKHVIGGGCGLAENDAGTANSGSAGAPGCGGGWHEDWNGYVNEPAHRGMNNWYVPSLRSWWKATGDNIFIREPWIKNFAYWTMYQTRPDFNWTNIGTVSRPYMVNEYDVGATSAGGTDLGSLDGLGEIYNDPTLRGWARLVNDNPAPDGFEPSAWPFFTPDKVSNTALTRSALSKTRNFPGVGDIFFRTSWGEDDSMCTLRYGENFWSHSVQDTGAFTCYKNGVLAIRSGTYRSGSGAAQWEKYGRAAISQNLPTILDAADVYPSETFTIYRNDGTTTEDPVPNDGGQRRAGSDYNQHFTAQTSPSDPAQWFRGREYYHTGALTGYAVGSGNKYGYAAVDMTAAYNNYWSRNAFGAAYSNTTANTSNRTFRVQKAFRQFVFIPRGTAAYVVVFDRIVSTNAAFVKKWNLHSINLPVVSGTSYTITRADTVTSKPYANLWPQYWAANITHCPAGCSVGSTQYTYSGKLYGWMAQPSAGSIAIVGGAANEFNIGGVNYNECMQGQCTAGEGLGATTGFVVPEPLTAPHEPGSYRLEQSVGSSNLADSFINIMLLTTNTDTNVPGGGNIPACTLSGSAYTCTWSDQTTVCTYTVTLPQDGVGGTITAVGAGCATGI